MNWRCWIGGHQYPVDVWHTNRHEGRDIIVDMHTELGACTRCLARPADAQWSTRSFRINTEIEKVVFRVDIHKDKP